MQSGNPNGVVVARSDDSNQEMLDAQGLTFGQDLAGAGASLTALLAGNLARIMQRDSISIPNGKDFYTTNIRDAGMRVRLPGAAGTTPTYFIRIRSANATKTSHTLGTGVTRGAYRLQVRLNEIDEFPGSTVRYSDLRYAGGGTSTGAIEVLGLPANSPFLGESTETLTVNNNTAAGAQDLGNLLAINRTTLGTAGNLGPANDVDFFTFTIDHPLTQGTTSTATWPVVIDVDFADELARANNTFAVYNAAGQLILVSRDSFVADDQPDPLAGNNTEDLSRGSFGFLDAFLGTIMMPGGQITAGTSQRYTIAVSSNATFPTTLEQYFAGGAADPLVRLEPLDSVRRIAEDHINSQGGSVFGPLAAFVRNTGQHGQPGRRSARPAV